MKAFYGNDFVSIHGTMRSHEPLYTLFTYPPQTFFFFRILNDIERNVLKFRGAVWRINQDFYEGKGLLFLPYSFSSLLLIFQEMYSYTYPETYSTTDDDAKDGKR